MNLCWDASLSIDRDTMFPFNIQPLKCFQQENKTEETGGGQTFQDLKQGRAIGRINLYWPKESISGMWKNTPFLFRGPRSGHICTVAHPRPGLHILRLSSHLAIARIWGPQQWLVGALALAPTAGYTGKRTEFVSQMHWAVRPPGVRNNKLVLREVLWLLCSIFLFLLFPS